LVTDAVFFSFFIFVFSYYRVFVILFRLTGKLCAIGTRRCEDAVFSRCAEGKHGDSRGFGLQKKKEG